MALKGEWNEKLIEAADKGKLNAVRACIANGAQVNFTCWTYDWNPLYYAVFKKHEEIVEFLLEKGADVNCSANYTALVQAIYRGASSIARLLVSKGADVNKGDPSPLVAAVQENNLEMVKFLINEGGNVDPSSPIKTPLMTAVECKHPEIVKFLLDSGANVSRESNGKTPLEVAVEKDLTEIIKIIIERDTNMSNKAFIASLKTQNFEMVKYLIDNGANINKPDEEGITPLSYSVRMEDIKSVKWLLKHGARFSAHSALLDAVDSQNLRIIRLLVSKGANVNVRHKNVHTALVKAIILKNLDIVEDLVDHKADLHMLSQGISPLIEAITMGQVEIVNFLLDRGANPNLSDGKGKLALITAIEKEQPEIVQKLLEKGVDVSQTDESNNVASDLLLTKYLESRNIEMTELLLNCKTDLLETVLKNGFTPLTKIVQIDDFKMIDFLVKRGANVNKSDNLQNYPLVLAASNLNFQSFECLLGAGADVDLVKTELESIAASNEDFGVYLEDVLGKKDDKERKESGSPEKDSDEPSEDSDESSEDSDESSVDFSG